MSPSKRYFRRLWMYLRPYWPLSAATFVTMLIGAVMQLALPIAIQRLIDRDIPEMIANKTQLGYWHNAAWFAVGLILIYIVVFFINWLRDYLAGRIGGQILADLRSQLFDRLEHLSLKFHHRHQVGEVLSRLMSDVSKVQELLSSTTLSIVTNLTFLVAILIYLVSLNWLLTLLALTPVPLMVYLTQSLGGRMNKVARQHQEATAELSAQLQESLSGLRTVKAFGREESERLRIDGILSRLKSIIVRYSVTQSISRSAFLILSFIGTIIVISVGSYLITIDRLTLGQLIAFFVLLGWMIMPIHAIANARIEVKAAFASVDRVFEYLDVPVEIAEDVHSVSLAKVRGEIKFDRVSFVYDSNGFEMRDFDLEIRSNEKVALVGPSGSGKTTVVNLLMRFFDPNIGAVLLDGIDLRNLSMRTLRNSIALVDQDPMLFRTSIRENIAYGNPDADQSQVVAAAKIANIHNFITALPNGYNTVVGERGVTLSGGEKQRICLARAVVRNPAVLILDEATSALDSISEQLIQEALDRILQDKTALIVAHRLSTVQRADRIIAMNNGRIVDQGTHHELMSRSSIYRELAERQLISVS